MVACEQIRVRAVVVDSFSDPGLRRIRCCTVLHRSEVMVSSLFVTSRALLFTHSRDLSAGTYTGEYFYASHVCLFVDSHERLIYS